MPAYDYYDPVFEGVLWWVRENGDKASVASLLKKGSNRSSITSSVLGDWIMYEFDYDSLKDESPASIRARVRKALREGGFKSRKSVMARKVVYEIGRNRAPKTTMRVTVKVFINKVGFWG